MKTSVGTIVIELEPAAAPKSVANFLEYVKSGFYEGTVFHRVIKGFMAQGGGYDKTYKQKETRAPIMNEGEAAEKAGVKNDRGTISMARTGDPHSATAQFYINFKDNTMLNIDREGEHAAALQGRKRTAAVPTVRLGLHRLRQSGPGDGNRRQDG